MNQSKDPHDEAEDDMGDVVLGICQISDMGKESKLSEGFCSKHCEASGREWIKEKFIRYSKEPGQDANIQEYDYCTPEYQNRKCKTCLARFSPFICRSICFKVKRVSQIYEKPL